MSQNRLEREAKASVSAGWPAGTRPEWPKGDAHAWILWGMESQEENLILMEHFGAPAVIRQKQSRNRTPPLIEGQNAIAESTIALSLSMIERRVAALEKAKSQNVVLTTLTPQKLKLRKNMNVSVTSNGDDFVATFFDANISATGDTAGEAVFNLKDVICLKFSRLKELSGKPIGPALKDQWAVLQEFIEA